VCIFSPDGKLVALSHYNNTTRRATLTLWDWKAKQVVKSVEPDTASKVKFYAYLNCCEILISFLSSHPPYFLPSLFCSLLSMCTGASLQEKICNSRRLCLLNTLLCFLGRILRRSCPPRLKSLLFLPIFFMSVFFANFFMVYCKQGLRKALV
jgi:hypothetical protein